jgi:hypothetical protein
MKKEAKHKTKKIDQKDQMDQKVEVVLLTSHGAASHAVRRWLCVGGGGAVCHDVKRKLSCHLMMGVAVVCRQGGAKCKRLAAGN